MTKKQTILLLLVVGTAFWGISFPVTKLAIGEQSPAVFLCYRFLLATIILSIIFWKKIKFINRSVIFTGISMAIPLVLGITLQTQGLKYSTASQCAFIAGTSVVIVPLLKKLFFRKSVAGKTWLAALVALAGLAVISVTSSLTIGMGDLFTFAGAFAFAFYLIWVEKKALTTDILPAIVPMFASCALFSFVLALVQGSNNVWIPQSNHFWTGIIFCGMFSTAFTYTISNISQKFISAEKVAVIYLFEPLFGAVAAWFLMDEAFTTRLLLGGAMIFAATLISEWNMNAFIKRISGRRVLGENVQ